MSRLLQPRFLVWFRMACLSSNLSAWYKVQSVNILLSSLAANVASESSEVCRNLWNNTPQSFSREEVVEPSVSSLVLWEGPQCVHNCRFSLTVEGGSSYTGVLCPRGPILFAGSYTLYSCVQAPEKAPLKAQQVPRSRRYSDSLSRKRGSSTLASVARKGYLGPGFCCLFLVSFLFV